MKTCPKCKRILSVSEFHKKRSKADGLDSWCKQCKIVAVRKYQETEVGKEAKRQYQCEYQRTQAGRETVLRATRKYQKNNPDKTKAHNATNNAIAAGQLAPASDFECQHCDQQAQEYHHYEGYAPVHWFDIIALCRACHRNIHNNILVNLRN